MKADFHTRQDTKKKEVAPVKQLAILALVVAVILVAAPAAFAFDGYRDTYVKADICEVCHGPGGIADPRTVIEDWKQTAHAMVGTVEIDPVTGELAGGTANAEPIADGPGCAGCHSSNYDTAKHIPDAAGVYPWENTLVGDDAFSEPFVGCSACHWGKNDAGNASPTAAHGVPMANMANADICGQCHTRYSNSVVAYPNYDGSSSLRQYTRGDFSPLGFYNTVPAWTPDPITDFLLVPSPAAPQQMRYYTYTDEAGVTKTLPFNGRSHEEGAAQYSEWAGEGHASALTDLKASSHANDSCLKCHSADYRMAPEGAKPTLATAKYGVTCVVCHDPHKQSAEGSFWNKEERNPQLTAPEKELCVECHTAELAEGTTFTPGTTVHNAFKEMMGGYGAIGVPQTPSVHKGRCVMCHMVPTAWGRVPDGGVEADRPFGKAANHVFAIVEPKVAAEATVAVTSPAGTKNMPMSSCSTCHAKANDPYATYLQETIEDRQAFMVDMQAKITTELGVAAGKLGYASTSAAVTALTKAGYVPSDNETLFLSAYTNLGMLDTEGSDGIHNWAYASAIANKALQQAEAVKTVPARIDITSPAGPPYYAGPITFGGSVTISGKVIVTDFSGLVGGQVWLWAGAGGAPLAPVASAFLMGPNSDMFSFLVKPDQNTKYAVQFKGTDMYAPLVSSEIAVDVKWKVTFSISKTRIKKNKSATLKGAVTPSKYVVAGTLVQIQRSTSSGWKNFTTVKVKADGTYSKSYKFTKTGTYKLRTTFPEGLTLKKGTSSAKTIKVVK